MTAPRIDMHRLQELVRLCRLGTGVRERARLLGMSTRTEREYRRLIGAADLLQGDPGDLPDEELLQAAAASAKPRPMAWHGSTAVDPWLPAIEAGMARGAGAQAIWDKLRREDPDFDSSLFAVKPAVQRLRRERGVLPEDVVIPVDTALGDVGQVDLGYAGRYFDGTNRAAIAVARKLAVLLHRLWLSGEVYEPVGYNRTARLCTATDDLSALRSSQTVATPTDAPAVVWKR